MNRVFIHNNNLCEKFENRVLYAQNIEVDKYISSNLLKKLEECSPDIIFIKDALTEQYIDLLGLRVAMHIRLSNGRLKNLPIVIVSELNHIILQKLSPLANILITKNVFLIKNTKKAIKNFDETLIKPFVGNEYDEKFLNLINIKAPKDYLDDHGISNEWSVYKWSKLLDTKSEKIFSIEDKANSMLFYQYAKRKNNINDEMPINHFDLYPTEEGRILFIDDEWDKGWNDILKKLFERNNHIKFETFKYDFKDKSNFNLIVQVNYKDLRNQIENADVIILDLRLIEQDHDTNTDIGNYSGIKILQKIHEINAGIQVIMLTATSKSTILEKLYEYKILGYIKKEHPDDIFIDTTENIEKFVKLIDKGLKNSYLKEIWKTQNSLLDLKIFQDIEMYEDIPIEDKKLLELKFAIPQIFTILDSNIESKEKFKFAVLSIFKCFEIICDYFIYEAKVEGQYSAYWRENDQYIGKTATNNKLQTIFRKRDILIDENEKNINKIVCTRNYIVHSANISNFCQKHNRTIRQIDKTYIITWFKLLEKIIIKI